MRGTLQCEPPNADLHVFKGRFDLAPTGAYCYRVTVASSQHERMASRVSELRLNAVLLNVIVIDLT